MKKSIFHGIQFIGYFKKFGYKTRTILSVACRGICQGQNSRGVGWGEGCKDNKGAVFILIWWIHPYRCQPTHSKIKKMSINW